MHPPILLSSTPSSPPVSLHQTRLVARKEMSTCSTCSFVITARGYLPHIRGVAKILREKVAITIHTTPRFGHDWMMDRFKIDPISFCFLSSFFHYISPLAKIHSRRSLASRNTIHSSTILEYYCASSTFPWKFIASYFVFISSHDKNHPKE